MRLLAKGVRFSCPKSRCATDCCAIAQAADAHISLAQKPTSMSSA